MITPIDAKQYRLGCKPPRIDPRTLQFARYAGILPPPPASCDWTQGVVSYGMMDNDVLGDCTCAAVGHGAQIATLNTGGEITPADSRILALYVNSCGYVIGDPSTDNGGVIIDVLNYNRQYGLGKARRNGKKRILSKFRLYAYSDPAVSNIVHIQQAIATFGMVDIGLNLPLTAQTQTNAGATWDVVGNPNTDPNSFPNSWGGHSVVVVAYDTQTLTCITWGMLQKMTYAFWNSLLEIYP